MKKFIESLLTRFSIVASLFRFLIVNKSWWMIPMILFLVLFFGIILIGQSSPLGPFIYAIF